MSIKVELGTLYASEEIPLMLFSSEEDANRFDLILIGYVNNDKAIEEFKRAENQYASDYAVQYNIDNGSFIKNVTGAYSDILIAAAEEMIDSAEDTLSGDDPYTATFNYIRDKLKFKK